jgi:uncharacterized protein (DUF2267 family)
MTVPATIAHAVQQTQIWLKGLRDAGDLADEQEAYVVLRAVLHQLRDRLTPQEAIDLGAQLPLIVRGLWYEGWTPSRLPDKVRTQERFLEELAERLRPHPVDVERAARDVFALLTQHCDPGEIKDVVSQLPTQLKQLWPPHARRA